MRGDARNPGRGDPGPVSRSARRESALRTEQAINRIESEMANAGAAVRPGAPASPTPEAADKRTGIEGRAADGTKVASTFAMNDLANAIVIDVQASDLPAILEEPAVLYANGQWQPAARILRRCLEDAGLDTHRPLAWLMLLDLHQCTGDRAGFDALAARYAERFDAAVPAWCPALSPDGGVDRAVPAPVGPESAPSSVAQPGSADMRRPADVMLYGALDGSIDGALRCLIDGEEEQAQLDVTAATAIDVAGAAALLFLFGQFEPASRTLVVRGARRLYGLVRASIEPGRRDSSEACWMLALHLLRALDRQAEFEDLAIEYCVTHEVSPPSWEPCPASIRLRDDEPVAGCADGAAARQTAGSAAGDAPASMAGLRGTRGDGAGSEDFAITASAAEGAFVLEGELSGRMQEEFEALRAYAAERGDIVIDCRRLRRIEFVAAGDLLNEIATMRSAGRQVLFIEPNYLVYALMLVMGIHDLAEIRRRRI